MKKLLVLHRSVFHIYDFILQNKNLPAHLYKDLLHIVIYMLLGQEIGFHSKSESIFLPTLYNKHVYLQNESLEKVLYLMDATSSLDDKGNVSLVIPSLYKEQIQNLLIGLLKNKKFHLKPIYDNIVFYINSYISICAKLRLDEDILLTSSMHNLRKKSNLIDVKVFSVVNNRNVTEVQFYSKYTNFDKEYCANYRFIVTKSVSLNFPVGSYVFGVLHYDKRTVTLYKDPKCLYPLD
jgi:hypothetical protein